MNIKTKVLFFGLILHLGFTIRLSACGPSFPMFGGRCTNEMMIAIRNEMSDRSNAMGEISARVKADRELHINEILRLASGRNIKSTMDFISDSETRKKLETLTPYGYARRAESLRSKMSDKEWTNIVNAWSKYLNLTSKSSSASPGDFCGAKESLSSIGTDAVLVVAMPIMGIAAMGVGAGVALEGQNDGAFIAASGPLLGVVGAVVNALYLTSDIAVLVPSLVLKHMSYAHLKHYLYNKQSIKAFEKFGKLVIKYEKKYSKS